MVIEERDKFQLIKNWHLKIFVKPIYSENIFNLSHMFICKPALQYESSMQKFMTAANLIYKIY